MKKTDMKPPRKTPTQSRSINRRQSIQTTIATGLSLSTGHLGSVFGDDLPAVIAGSEAAGSGTKPWLRRTLKLGMIKGESLADRFQLAIDAGFEGVEPNVPGVSIEEAVSAAKQTGLIIDGTVGGYHWKIRHTDSDPAVRKQALDQLKKGLQETADMGADTMLLVPGHGRDGDAKEVYDRAIAAVSEVLPVCEKTGVSILIENVWNQFLYDHDGGSDQTADALAEFIDEFNSPLVGVQFDIGNHWKYGDPAGWIRTLGDRIKKLDIKGFSRQDGRFTKITEGDIVWPSVKKALQDIGFTGWLAAEVGGGDLERLVEVREHMDAALQCDEPARNA